MNDPSPRPTTIGYATPERGRIRFSWFAFVISGTVLGFVAAVMWVLVPAAESVFADFKLELPAATKVVIGLSRVSRSPGGLLYPVLATAAGFAAPAIAARVPPAYLPSSELAVKRLIGAIVGLLCVLVVLLVALIGLLMPFITIGVSIAGERG